MVNPAGNTPLHPPTNKTQLHPTNKYNQIKGNPQPKVKEDSPTSNKIMNKVKSIFRNESNKENPSAPKTANKTYNVKHQKDLKNKNPPLVIHTVHKEVKGEINKTEDPDAKLRKELLENLHQDRPQRKPLEYTLPSISSFDSRFESDYILRTPFEEARDVANDIKGLINSDKLNVKDPESSLIIKDIARILNEYGNKEDDWTIEDSEEIVDKIKDLKQYTNDERIGIYADMACIVLGQIKDRMGA